MSMHKRVKVCVRVRPNTRPSMGIVLNEHEKTISVTTNAQNGNGTCFHFDDILSPQMDQRQTYDATASDVVESVMNGYNGTILAYGQTGAGKTFTMSGGKQSFDQRGICARSISSIFRHIQRDPQHEYTVRVSFVEIYNEILYDLLDFTADSDYQIQQQAMPHKELIVQENDKGLTFIKGLAKPRVDNEEQALDLLFQGETNRTIAEHALNASSTRSHCIFTIYVEKTTGGSGGSTGGGGNSSSSSASEDAVVVSSKLNLVDLAGSERMKKTNVTGNMLKEASHINKSLTFLEQVVIALGDKKRDHIPYRQTLLTNILKDSLGGNCRTLMIACVWPDESHNDQTIATLKFATRMMRVKTSAVVNVQQNASQKVQRYEMEIQKLKEELALHDLLSGRSKEFIEYGQLSDIQKEKYSRQVQEYVSHPETATIPIVNIAQIEYIFQVFRDLVLSNLSSSSLISRPSSFASTIGAEEVEQQQQQMDDQSSKEDTALKTFYEQRQQQQQQPQGVTNKKPPQPPAGGATSRTVKNLRTLKASSGTTGVAATSSLPNAKNMPTPTSPPLQSAGSTFFDMSVPENYAYLADVMQKNQQASSVLAAPAGPVMSDKELFEEFKQQAQPSSAGDLDLSKENLKRAKKKLNQMGVDVNTLKIEIDALTLKIQVATSANDQQQQQEESGGTGPQDTSAAPPSSVELDHLMVQLKDAKKRYRDSYDKFQQAKTEVTYFTKVKDQMVKQLTRDFEIWRETTTTSRTTGTVVH